MIYIAGVSFEKNRAVTSTAIEQRKCIFREVPPVRGTSKAAIIITSRMMLNLFFGF
jgi:hypothetical protein